MPTVKRSKSRVKSRCKSSLKQPSKPANDSSTKSLVKQTSLGLSKNVKSVRELYKGLVSSHKQDSPREKAH